MPLIVALHLCTVCAVGALAMQSTQRNRAAWIAAALVAISPLATFGTVQQLLPQVWGLGLAAALVAWLMRPEMHIRPGARPADMVSVGLLGTGIILVYVELASTVALAYVLYVAVLAIRRMVHLVVFRLWLPAVAITIVVLNGYLLREMEFVRMQANSGVKGGSGIDVFGFALLPRSLPAIFGFHPLSPSPNAFGLRPAIVVTLVLLGLLVAYTARSALRGSAPSIVLCTYVCLALFLGLQGSGFGVYKIYMYAQPFLAAAVAIWLAQLTNRLVLPTASLALLVVVGIQLHTQHSYIARSQNPVDLPHASSVDLLPHLGACTARLKSQLFQSRRIRRLPNSKPRRSTLGRLFTSSARTTLRDLSQPEWKGKP